MTLRLRLALLLYRLAWLLALPLALRYFRRRARKDPAYGAHMDERLGRGPTLDGAVWVHAVSLGEMRSAAPLVRALLDRGEKVVSTHHTPAGRRAAETLFPEAIAEGRLLARYAPLDHGPSVRRFLAATRPKLALVLEVEIWPTMIAEARRADVPLYLANSQVPSRSYPRAHFLKTLLGHPVAGTAGTFAKSDRHAARFRALGAPNVQTTGELRFDQPIPERLLAAAARLKPQITRPVVAVASVVEGEDALYLGTYHQLQANGPAPLFLHIPRAPERFGPSGDFLAAQGQKILRRSTALTADLAADAGALNAADILLGDSMGEMYFYLALADVVVVGGGFLPSAAHNIIEPLALRKPVLTGPNIWTIEYPAEEAIAAGVLTICDTPETLAREIARILADPGDLAGKAETFFTDHAGATERITAYLDPILKARS